MIKKWGVRLRLNVGKPGHVEHEALQECLTLHKMCE